jgi:prefoldin subunit 5
MSGIRMNEDRALAAIESLERRVMVYEHSNRELAQRLRAASEKAAAMTQLAVALGVATAGLTVVLYMRAFGW